MKIDWKEEGKKVPFIVAGNAILALGVVAFIVPGGLISGGATGLALLISHLLPVDISLALSALNFVLFFVGAAFLGRRFALSTLLSSVLYPLFVKLFQSVPALTTFTDNILLQTVYSGLLVGLGVGLVLRVGSSTGGMDIPPVILHEKMGLPLAGLMYSFDTVILLCQIGYSSAEQVLFGVLEVLISALVMSRVLLLGKSQTQAMIISPKYQEISQAIQEQLERGTTLLAATTGYLLANQQVVMAVVSNRELARLKSVVTAIDPQAFMVLSEVGEVRGRGFSFEQERRRRPGQTR
ncbi:YitT family protein [Bittarella massiliensis (ex Durand et al. 2017)]|uniref:YitT family protein n=1 Tax=Bittarella massiliensis (ex Durand et al. 2017) TaxID=1720313 RepID=A0AAW5KBQ8_9FIRM|nr:YitT family protein [Bittarella massiliensis (ex Durand et al. 2017)]MCQ4950043.1 YitT family protein [Bittarella massiliensis (ex Durand et al. 2017)]